MGSIAIEATLDDIRDKLVDIEKSLYFVARYSENASVKNCVDRIVISINSLGRYERNGIYQVTEVISSLNEI